jgi:phosphoribosyl 1,2-cyclic phosphate phosphodiesterase
MDDQKINALRDSGPEGVKPGIDCGTDPANLAVVGKLQAIPGTGKVPDLVQAGSLIAKADDFREMGHSGGAKQLPGEMSRPRLEDAGVGASGTSGDFLDDNFGGRSRIVLSSRGGVLSFGTDALMEIIFLGTGTSQGVPMIACDCEICLSPDPRDKRTRTSVHVVMDGYHVQVDAAQEFRLQCLANSIDQIDLVLLTHGHADHILGMDDLRRFCDMRGGENLPVYSTPEGMKRVQAIYPYAILDRPLVPGYPAFQLREMPEVLEVPGGIIRSVRLPHGSVEVLGLVFEERSSGRKFTYYTDCKRVEGKQREMARGSDVVVLDALRQNPHPSHMNIEEAIEAALAIAAPRTFFTHLTHTVQHKVYEQTLPPGIFLAHDGLRIEL